MLQDLVKGVGAEDLLGYALGAFAMLCGVVVVAICLITNNWRRIRQHQLDIALKRDMLDRGMSASDIERVMGSTSVVNEAKVTSYPTASDVVVEWESDWYPAILLKTDGAKYYVHYKGYDEEEWVTLDRIRFPAQPQPAGVPEPQAAVPEPQQATA